MKPRLPSPDPCESGRWLRRLRQLGWLVLIWSASVLTLGVIALLMRMLMNAAGMGK